LQVISDVISSCVVEIHAALHTKPVNDESVRTQCHLERILAHGEGLRARIDRRSTVPLEEMLRSSGAVAALRLQPALGLTARLLSIKVEVPPEFQGNAFDTMDAFNQFSRICSGAISN